MNAGALSRRWFTALLDLLYPPRCGGCGSVGQGEWCEDCAKRVKPLREGDAIRVLRLTEGRHLTVVSAARFQSPLREAIHAFKYEGTPQLSQPLARFMVDALTSAGLTIDLVAPVPLHTKRQRERGYNQSELLARHISRIAQMALDTRAIVRVRHTHQQATLGGPDARQANVKGAFEARQETHCRVLLVDDVFTTGATLSECAAALFRAGARDVTGLTLARAD